MNEPIPGRYRHYKGKEYTVLGLVRHSETHEELVIYRQEYGNHGLWVRPKEMFLETVMVDGKAVPRFQPLGSRSEQVGDSITNIFDELPQHLPKELVQTLIRAADVRIERIISHGHASPEGLWYDQDQHEFVVVLKGAARLRFEDGIVEMKPGDFFNIPAHSRRDEQPANIGFAEGFLFGSVHGAVLDIGLGQLARKESGTQVLPSRRARARIISEYGPACSPALVARPCPREPTAPARPLPRRPGSSVSRSGEGSARRRSAGPSRGQFAFHGPRFGPREFQGLP